jgi:hypothetical protein
MSDSLYSLIRRRSVQVSGALVGVYVGLVAYWFAQDAVERWRTKG